MEKDYIIARVKDASGENFDKFEHTIIGLYDSEENISIAFEKWLKAKEAKEKAEKEAKEILDNAEKERQKKIRDAEDYWVALSAKLESFYQEHAGLREILSVNTRLK